MFEKLKFPETNKVTIQLDPELKEITELKIGILSKKADDKIPGLKEAKSEDEKKLIRDKFSNAIKTKYNNTFNEIRKELGRERMAYEKLWTEATELISKDPILSQYMHKYNCQTSISGFETLSNYFRGKGQTGLAGQIDNMKNLFSAMQEICKGNLDEANLGSASDKVQRHTFSINKNQMQIIVENLNQVNNLDMDKEFSKKEKPGKSLLEEAYEYSDENGYGGIESQLAVRLGQLSGDLINKFAAIEYTGKILDQKNGFTLTEINNSLSTMGLDEFKNEDPETFFNDVDGRIKDLQDKNIAPAEQFEGWMKEKNYTELENNYGKSIDAYLALGEKKYIENAIEDAKKTHDKNYEENLKWYLERNENNRKHNEEEIDRYKKEINHNSEINKKKQLLSEAAQKEISGIENEIRLANIEMADYKKKRDEERDSLSEKWRNYSSEKERLDRQISEYEKDLELYEKMSTQMSDNFFDEIGEYNLSKKLSDKLFDAQDTLFKLGGGGFSSRDFVNKALSMDDIGINDITAADNPAEIGKLYSIQQNWKNYKEAHPDLKNYFKAADQYKGRYKEGMKIEYGPFNAFDDEFQKVLTKNQDMYREHSKYFEAQEKLTDIRTKFGGNKFPTPEELEDLKAQRQSLESNKPEEFDYKSWDAETEKTVSQKSIELNTKLNTAKLTNEKKMMQLDKDLVKVMQPELYLYEEPKEIKEKFSKEQLEQFEKTKKTLSKDKQIEYRKKYYMEAVNTIKSGLDTKKNQANAEIERLKRLKGIARTSFEKDRLATTAYLKDEKAFKENTAFIKDEKSLYYSRLAENLRIYEANMEKGKSKWHTNSPEFEHMCNVVKACRETVENYLSDSPDKPNLDAVKASLAEMSKGAKAYYDKKTENKAEKGIFSSAMRGVRLEMSKQLTKLGNETVQAIDGYENLGKIFTNKLMNNKPQWTANMLTEEELKSGAPDKEMNHFKKVFAEYKAKSKEASSKLMSELITEVGLVKPEEKQVNAPAQEFQLSNI